jgi:hypothetical protein
MRRSPLLVLLLLAGPASAADPADARASALLAAMPDPQFTQLERAILGSTLTDQAFQELVVARAPAERLHHEALDAANLAVADQNDEQVRGEIRDKTLFRAGSLPELAASAPVAPMSRLVCGALDRFEAGGGANRSLQQAVLLGEQADAAKTATTAEAASADADVIKVDSTALPGVRDYCARTRAEREAAERSSVSSDNRPVKPARSLSVKDVPGARTGDGRKRGGGLGGALMGLLPFMAGGAGGGALAAALVGLGPLGLLAGFFAGAAVGAVIGLIVRKK